MIAQDAVALQDVCRQAARPSLITSSRHGLASAHAILARRPFLLTATSAAAWPVDPLLRGASVRVGGGLTGPRLVVGLLRGTLASTACAPPRSLAITYSKLGLFLLDLLLDADKSFARLTDELREQEQCGV